MIARRQTAVVVGLVALSTGGCAWPFAPEPSSAQKAEAIEMLRLRLADAPAARAVADLACLGWEPGPDSNQVNCYPLVVVRTREEVTDELGVWSIAELRGLTELGEFGGNGWYAAAPVVPGYVVPGSGVQTFAWTCVDEAVEVAISVQEDVDAAAVRAGRCRLVESGLWSFSDLVQRTDVEGLAEEVGA